MTGETRDDSDLLSSNVFRRLYGWICPSFLDVEAEAAYGAMRSAMLAEHIRLLWKVFIPVLCFVQLLAIFPIENVSPMIFVWCSLYACAWLVCGIWVWASRTLLARFRARLDVICTWSFLVPLCLLNSFSGRQLLEMLGDVPHHSDVPAVNGVLACFALVVFLLYRVCH